MRSASQPNSVPPTWFTQSSLERRRPRRTPNISKHLRLLQKPNAAHATQINNNNNNKIFGETVHGEQARGSSLDNRRYCNKGEDVLLEIGELPAEDDKPGTNRSTHYANIVAKKLANGADLYKLAKNEEYGNATHRHYRTIMALSTSRKKAQCRKKVRRRYRDAELRPLQAELEKELFEPP